MIIFFFGLRLMKVLPGYLVVLNTKYHGDTLYHVPLVRTKKLLSPKKVSSVVGFSRVFWNTMQ